MTHHLESTTPREQLAAYRTDLANERTGLAYVRTALTAFVVGVTFIKFFGSLILTVLGWIFIPLSAVLFFLGLGRYQRMRTIIHRIRRASHIT